MKLQGPGATPGSRVRPSALWAKSVTWGAPWLSPPAPQLPALFFLLCPSSGFFFSISFAGFSFSCFPVSLSLPSRHKNYPPPPQVFFFFFFRFSFFFFSFLFSTPPFLFLSFPFPPFSFSLIPPPCHSFPLLPCPFCPLPQFHLFFTFVSFVLNSMPGRGFPCRDRTPPSSQQSITPIPHPCLFLPSFFPAGGLDLPWGGGL